MKTSSMALLTMKEGQLQRTIMSLASIKTLRVDQLTVNAVRALNRFINLVKNSFLENYEIGLTWKMIHLMRAVFGHGLSPLTSQVRNYLDDGPKS